MATNYVGKATYAWEVWSRDTSYSEPDAFVGAFADKGNAQRRMRALKKHHPHVTYFLKHRSVPAHVQGKKRATRRTQRKWGW